MNPKKLVIGSMVVGGLALLGRALFANLGTGKLKSQSEVTDSIDAYILKQMRRLNIPGGIVAIVEGDKIIHMRGFGRANPGGQEPSPQTPFFIGSLTKSITALAIMQLVESGQVRLEAPVQQYLPWFKVADPEASAKMTIEQLLYQTSGLPEGAGERVLGDFDPRPDANERQIRGFFNLKLAHPVGSKVAYSNLNYNILGLVIEKVSGESYSDYTQNHILKPLQMDHTYSSVDKAKQYGLAMGYRHWFSLPFPARRLPVPIGSLPSGQLISTAEDMAHYLIAHINGGHYLNEQVLSKPGVEILHRGKLEYIRFGISAGKYAMGWFDINIGNIKTFSHGGNVPDFSSFMVILPEHKKGLVLLFNADPYGMPPVVGEVGMGVTALLAGLQPSPIRLDFIQWIFRLLPLIPILQAAGVIATARKINTWTKNPHSRPNTRRIWSHHILAPLIPNLALAGTFGALVAKKMFGFTRLFMPDLSWILAVSGSFAGIWAMLRTFLLVRTIRKP